MDCKHEELEIFNDYDTFYTIECKKCSKDFFEDDTVILTKEKHKELEGENKITMKEAAVINCYLCQGLHRGFSPEPYFLKGQDSYVHGGYTGASNIVPCLSSQLYNYIEALEKSNQPDSKDVTNG